MNYTFHWYQAFRSIPQMLSGAILTVEAAVASMAIATIFGIVLALCRRSRYKALYGVSTCWIDVARNTPALYQIYLAYFGLASLGIHLDSLPALLAGISFNAAGYMAETFRGGLRAIPPTQMRAARSLGMGAPMAFRLIVLPQMFRIVFYPMTNQMIWNVLLTSLGVIVGLDSDLMGVTQRLNTLTYRTFEYFSMAAVMYYCIVKILLLCARLVGARLFRY